MRDRLELTNYQTSWPNVRVGSESHFARIRFVPPPSVWPENAEIPKAVEEVAMCKRACGYEV